MLMLDRRVRTRRLEEVAAPVVILVGLEQAGAPPTLDAVRTDVETLCHFMQGQQATRAQPIVAAGQRIVDPDTTNHRAVEGFAVAGDQALVVEPVRDFTIGVIFEESVNLGDDGARRLAQHPGRLGQREVQRVHRTTAEAYLRPDVGLFEQGDIRDQQPGHPLALPVSRTGIVPQAWEVFRQRKDGGALLVIEPGLALALFVVVLLGRRLVA